jgi:hypothetical protein
MKNRFGILLGTVVAAVAYGKMINARRRRSSEGRIITSASPARREARPPAQPGGRDRGAGVLIPTAMAAGGITLFSKMSHGNSLRYTFVPTLAASWVLYMLALRRRRPDLDRLMPLYFVSLSWQFLHFVEENHTGFRYRWPVEIFRTEPYGDEQFVAINVISYALFILGGVALMVDRRELSLPAVFFAVMGVMFNGVQHPIYAWMVRGYFPGLWTSTADLVLGPVLLKRLFEAPVAEPRLS